MLTAKKVHFIPAKNDIFWLALTCIGRNYIEAGSYIEVFFPHHNVRYIAITDGVDSLNRQGMDIIPFKNILNDMYSASAL